MRNPARKILYCLLALVVSAGLILFGIERHEAIGEHWTSIVPLFVGFTIAPFALVILIQALFAARGRARLLRGDGVIARWQVYPGEWRQFRDLDRKRSAEDSSLGNDMRLRKDAPLEPVEVIVGVKSALVDGSYHSLSPRGLPELRWVGWLDGPPTCLEFSLLYPRGRYGGSVPMTLRIPVPSSARADARRVVAHFEPLTRRSPGLALRNPPRTYRICAALFLGAAAAGGVAWLHAGTLPDGADPRVPLAVLVASVVVAVFAAVLALATFLLARRI
jgi:hypothetical protein